MTDDRKQKSEGGTKITHEHQFPDLKPISRKRRRDHDAESARSAPPKPGSLSSSQTSSLKEHAKQLYKIRKALPIFSHAKEIHGALREHDVMLLVGETGSGKSTQVPQFLINEPWCKMQNVKLDNSPDGADGTTVKVGGCIAITQPRRVAATSLARRVAEEMGTPLGSSSPASKVGYSVRFDTSTSPSTQIKFLTEGMLLQEILKDPWLRQYSAIVVDEVHERGVNVDLVLGFLRNMVAKKTKGNGRGGIPLKVVAMSATANIEGLLTFFNEGYKKEKAEISTKKTESVEGSGDSENDNRTTKGQESKAELDYVSVCHIEGRQFPVKTHYTKEPVAEWPEAALKRILEIHMKEPLPGDILVFLTGQETIENLEKEINTLASGMDPKIPKLLILPLFAALPQTVQQRIFERTPHRTRKVILATNIAETSVTVPGVRYVIDCGKSKIKQFRARLGLESLLVKPISKSAAIQRKGRAGREAPGECYRIYTENDYLELQQANTPEILRCDLSQAILTMKARGIDEVWEFPLLNPPKIEVIEKALLQLFHLQALTDEGKISKIGLQMAKFPLSPRLARILIAGAESDCLLEIIDIISCLSVENVFIHSKDQEEEEKIASARQDIFRRGSDHLTLLATVQGFAGELGNRKAWAEARFLSHRAMRSVMDVRKQLRAQCISAHLTNQFPEILSASSVSSEQEIAIKKAFLRGYCPFNTARLVPDGSYRTMIGNQTLAIHPSSVLRGMKAPAVMYNEYVFTTKSFARGVSAIELSWIGEMMGSSIG
ncbi:MAG: putative ATP-dependent RNA helicase dhr2 [Cirrosporium novae-zelandiae]|nr:MAG: putative ATP-dependent RNA helicase dhr2 [Cirrosporium novae-zelandiae]